MILMLLFQVVLRIIALTPKVFFSRASWHNIVDFFVVFLAFAATIAAMVIIENIADDEKEVGGEDIVYVLKKGPRSTEG